MIFEVSWRCLLILTRQRGVASPNAAISNEQCKVCFLFTTEDLIKYLRLIHTYYAVPLPRRVALIHTYRAVPLPSSDSPRVAGKIPTANRETPCGSRKKPNLGRSPTCCRETADVSLRLPCRGLEKSLAKRHGRSTAWYM
jgi:hypothetical protein